MKKRNRILRFCAISILTAAVLMLVSCEKEKKEENEEESEIQSEKETSTLTLNKSGVLLKAGESFQLEAETAGTAVSYASSDASVATVSESGLITAVAKGNAVITVSVGDAEEYCGVIVGLEETALVDIRQTEPKRIVSEQYLLHASVLRDFVVVNDEIYYIQRNDSQPSDLTLQHVDEEGHVDEWMTFYGFGGGVSISAEAAENGGWYLWIESNGNTDSEGQTISRIPYEPGMTYQGQGGQTWYFNQPEGPVYASVDRENRLVCVRTVSDGGFSFTYYDYETMVEGEELIPLYKVELDMLTSTLSADVNPTAASVGEHQFRGFATYGPYIYQYYGTANSAMLLAVYDMNGEAQYVHNVSEYGDLVFREPDGMYIADGKLYLGVTTGESADRRANILLYE